MGDFNFQMQTAEDIFRVLLLQSEELEEKAPLKSVRENKIYTIRNYDLESITCDDNGAYHKSNGNKKDFYVDISGSTLNAKVVHESKGKYFYKEKDGRFYSNCYVDADKIFSFERYYRWNKSIPQLKRTIYRIKNAMENVYHPFLCVVYSLHEDVERVQDIEILPHGNSKKKSDLKRPYFRTEPSVLAYQNSLLSRDKGPQEVYEIVLEESGGPLKSTSMSKEPRNLKQIQNQRAKIVKNKKNSETAADPLDLLMQAQRDPSSFVKTVVLHSQFYIAFAYTDKQIADIEQFCCSSYDSSVLAVDTTFNLCDLWITDTTYRNKRIVKVENGKHPVHLGPIMLHFSKDKETFGRFALELLAASPDLKELKTIGVDLESAIFNGFKNIFPDLSRLICVGHLRKRDEVKLNEILSKTGKSVADKRHCSSEVTKDIYGTKDENYYEYGLADATDENDFCVKLESLKDRWESLCPNFFQWFLSKRKSLFLESIIQSARAKSDITGLYYQNDIESMHAAEKRKQNYKKEDIITALANIQSIIRKEENDEIRALYSAG